MHTGWLKYDGHTFYFDPSDGVMHDNWTYIGDDKYFFTYDGYMLTGRQTIRGNKYYIAADGKVQKGLIKLDDGTYYFRETDGVMQTGWQTIAGVRRYFDTSTGKMAVNTRIDGYNIDANGVAKPMSSVQKQAASVINTIGKGVSTIYNYLCASCKYKHTEDTKSLATIQSMGWSYFADYAMKNRYMVCYYMAAVTELFYQEAGYKTRIVYGTGRGTGDHYWNQVYVNGSWLNYDICNGLYGVTDSFLKTPNNYDSAGRNTGNGYTFRQYIYPSFN